MAKAPTPKNDQIRALREAKFARGQVAAPAATKETLTKAVNEAAARADAAHAKRKKRKAARKARQPAAITGSRAG